MTARRLLLRATWIGSSSLIVAAALIVFFAWLALQIDWKVPDPLALTGPTTITARDGTVLARFDSEVDRRIIDLRDVSPAARNAVVASEDERFFQHRGVDPLGLLRAIVSNVRTGRVHQGGSTLTQQYVKNAFVGDDPSVMRKVREAVISVQLERRLSKRQILERYLNTVYFGEGAYGVEAAALTYFGVQARDLTPAQGATLAQLLPAPSRWNPRADPDGALARRDSILHDMHRLGTLSQHRLDRALKTRLRLVPEEQPRYAVPYFVAHVRAQLEATYGEAAVLTGALDVHTTIDLDAQRSLEEAVAAQLPEDAVGVDAGAIALDPGTGDIIAMYGGRDFYDPAVGYAQVNLATQGDRQPGSTFKPFVFIAALEQGMSPETRYDAPARVTIGDWSPANADLRDHGTLTLAEAMVGSVNTVFAQLGVDVGAEAIVDVARRLGVRRVLEPEITISLGAGAHGPSVLDMTSAFGAIGNDGIACPARAIVEVRGPGGELLPPPEDEAETTEGPTAAPSNVRDGTRCAQAVDRDIARTTTQVLEEVVARGTGTRADIGRPQAGKTGTTDDYADAWFVGYTPDLAIGVWVGDPTQRRSLRDIAGFDAVFGGTVPALIWRDAAAAILADTPPTAFAEPGELGGRRPGPTSRRTPTPGPTPTPSPSPEPKATRSPRGDRSDEPSDPPTTEEPSPTEEPTTAEPSQSPTPSPSPSPTPSPSPSPTPTPTDDTCIPLVTCDL